MSVISEILARVTALAPNGRIENAEFAARMEHVVWDDDVVPAVWLAPPAPARDVRKLQELLEKRHNTNLPADLTEFLEHHNGMAAIGVEEGESVTVGEPSNEVMPAAQMSVAWDHLIQASQVDMAPEGVLPFFRAEADQLNFDALVVDDSHPDFGKVVSIDATSDGPENAELIESHPLIAESFTDWLSRWVEAAFDNLEMPHQGRPAREEKEHGSVEVGDIFELPSEYGFTGKGFHWAMEITDLDGDGKLWVRFVTIADSRRRPDRGAQRVLPRAAWLVAPQEMCKKVDEDVRNTLQAKIDPSVREQLPGSQRQ